MSARVAGSQRIALIVVACSLAVLLGGQAMLGSVASASAGSAAVESLGDAGLAYLSGLRTYAAAVLWNRLEPVMHNYYEGMHLSEQRYMLSTIQVVTWLDPELDQPYYVGAWILATNDRVDEALALARHGVENRPDSGILRVSYAQILQLFAGDDAAALENALSTLEDDVYWRNDLEKHDGYSIVRGILLTAGEEDRAGQVLVEIERLDALIGDELPSGAHDHDGDGVPDH